VNLLAHYNCHKFSFPVKLLYQSVPPSSHPTILPVLNKPTNLPMRNIDLMKLKLPQPVTFILFFPSIVLDL
jgi:hypothetical protein